MKMVQLLVLGVKTRACHEAGVKHACLGVQVHHDPSEHARQAPLGASEFRD